MVPQERVRVIMVHLLDRTALSWGEAIMEPLLASVVPDGLSAPNGYTVLVEGVHTMLRSSPFLLFDGNCAEAMTFYHACLGGELTLTKLGETPMKDGFPPEKHERIINA